jgi:hypothetical protein
VKGFTLYVVGEGIEKKQDDFAAEVAAQWPPPRRPDVLVAGRVSP